MADRFMIAPMTIGLQNNLRPWLVPDSAFAQLNNAYVYKGRVRKRFGSFLLNTSVADELQPSRSRLRINIGNTAAVTGNFAGVVPGVIFKVGQQFSIGTTIFTVSDAGSPAVMLTTGTATGTYDTATGAVTITGNTENPTTAVYFYPAEPVMGFTQYESASINFEPTYAFDTQFSYQYTGGGWEVLSVAAAGIWTGTNSDFFWSENYRGVAAYDGYLFTTNFVTADRIRYWDGANWNILSGAAAQYGSVAGDEIRTARLILSFQGRLVLLNTVENIGVGMNFSFPNRVRYSQVGSPVSANPFREDIGGKGGFIDAPTKEAIVSARVLKNRLIVYFERSTYELVYTGNQELPFTFQQINNELGVESTFSTIIFDRSIIGIGNVGVHACNGAYVERIDQKIQLEIFSIKESGNGVKRVFGIRDFFAELVYWTMPSNVFPGDFPNRVMVYNYENSTWAFNDDSITAFGYYQPNAGVTWSSSAEEWSEEDDLWSSGQLEAQFRHVIAGNQEGFTFLPNPEVSRNSPSLQISKITVAAGQVTMVVVDNNLQPGDFVMVENAQGVTGFNDIIYEVIDVSGSNVVINQPAIAGTYTGLGTLTRISRIDIQTKQYNFYVEQGRNASVSEIDFFVDKTEEGSITVDFWPNDSTLSATSFTLSTAPYLDENGDQLYPMETFQNQLWHQIYPFAEGNLIQLRIYFNDDQMLDKDIVWSDFEMHAMTFHADPSSARMQ